MQVRSRSNTTHLGIHETGHGLLGSDGHAELSAKLLDVGGEVHGGDLQTRADGALLGALQHQLLHGRREASVREAQIALHEAHDALGEVHRLGHDGVQ
jgi:hypothetical protein